MEYKVIKHYYSTDIENYLNKLAKTHLIHNIWTSGNDNGFLIIIACTKK